MSSLPEQLRELRERADRAEADRRAAVTRADAYESRAKAADERTAQVQEHADKLADLLGRARADLEPARRERDELLAEIGGHRQASEQLAGALKRAEEAEARAAAAEARAAALEPEAEQARAAAAEASSRAEAQAAEAAALAERAAALEAEAAERSDEHRRELNKLRREGEKLRKELEAALAEPEPTGIAKLLRRPKRD